MNEKPIEAPAQALSTEQEPLKPCPFCGGTAEYARNDFHGDNSMARCKTCGATAFWSKWQARAALSAPASMSAENRADS